jgi:glycerol uptake facilitator-like aquaporin
MSMDLARRVVSEFLGTAFLLAAIVGSGILADRLSGGNAAIALFATTSAISAALLALILTFGPISGAHLNPAVTISDALVKGISWRDACLYIPAQVIGAVAGVAAANVMFDYPVLFASTKARTGTGQWFSEFVAAFGLLAVIWGCSRIRSKIAVPMAVSAYIFAAIWFTSSTSFANPAVTLARSMSDTYAGIRLADVPAFVIAQLLGGLAATFLFRWLVPGAKPEEVIMPHEGGSDG